VVFGAQEIAVGDAKVALCGGTENMSLAPYAVRGNRFGTRLGSDLILEDTLWAGLTDSYAKLPMALVDFISVFWICLNFCWRIFFCYFFRQLKI
jgi:acetyl-CoA acetyltransferase